MWNRVFQVGIGAIAVAACTTSTGPETPYGLTPSAGADGGGDMAPARSGSGSSSGTTPVTSASGASTGSSGASQGGGADASVSDVAADDGGSAPTTSPNPPTTSASQPTIPAIMGDCPKLATGTITIQNPMGGTALPTTIQAGTPGETKGSLLFAFHGTGGTAASAIAGVPMNAIQDITSGGGMVVAFQSPNAKRSGTDISPPMMAWYVEDLNIVDQVVACSIKNNNIDPTRIYATGCSAGGLMSGTMGLMRSQYVAAVAPNSGGINYLDSRQLSDKTHSPAAFCMHGGSSDMVIISFAQASQWFEQQAAMATHPGLLVDCNTNGGHCGAPEDLLADSWTFMKMHPFAVTPEPYANGLPSTYPSYCTIVK